MTTCFGFINEVAVKCRIRQPVVAIAVGICVAAGLIPGPLTDLTAAEHEESLATLTIRETHDLNRSNVAVCSGLPFPRGSLGHVAAVVAQSSSGDAVECQFDVLTRWDDGSVKWGLMTVVVPELTAGGSFEFQLVRSDSPTQTELPEIQRLDDGFRVDYPGFSVTTNRLGLPESVLLRKREQDLEFVDSGSQLLLLGEPVDPAAVRLEDVQIEEQGPVRTVVLSRGTITADEDRSSSFVSRVSVFSNGQVATSYTTINHQVGGFHGFGVQLGLATGFRDVQLGEMEPALSNSAGNAAQAERCVRVRQTGPETAVFDGSGPDGRTVQARYHGGLRLSGDSKCLGLAIHDFWQRYPSELTVKADAAQLWFYPPEAEDGPPLYRVGRAACGEFTIRVAGSASADWSAAELGQTDLHGFAGPEYYRDSGVLGRYILGDYPLPQGTYHGYVTAHMSHLQKRKFRINEFGFWDYGDGRGSADSAFRRNNEFGISYAMLFHFLRTGDVRFFEEGVAFAKHFRDVDTLHFGDMSGKSIRHTDYHVEGSIYGTDHQWVEGMLLEYLLTGDRRSLEVAREMGVPLLEFVREISPQLSAKPHVIPTTERHLGWTLMSLMFLEDITGDPQYTESIQALVAGLVVSQDEQRGHWPRSLAHSDFPTGGAPFMVGVLTEALMRYHEKTDDPDVRRALIRNSYWLSDEMWNPEVRNIRYKQWDRFWDSYNDGRTIPMILPGMVYARHLGRSDERYSQIIDDTLKVYARSCADLERHGEGRNFKSMGMMSRSMPRFFYYYDRTRQRKNDSN